MSQELLHGVNVRARLQQLRRVGMPGNVPANRLRKSCSLPPLPKIRVCIFDRFKFGDPREYEIRSLVLDPVINQF